MQEDGVFYSALSEIMQYIKPVQKIQSTGNTKTSLCTTEEKVWHLAIEEKVGINKDTDLSTGYKGTSASAYNVAGEGSVYNYFQEVNVFDRNISDNNVWSRSPATNADSKWNQFNPSGNMYNSNVSEEYRVRPCFCI